MEQIASLLHVRRQTIYNWMVRFQQNRFCKVGLGWEDAPRSGRPCTAKGVIDPLIDSLIDLDPHYFGYRFTTWTAPLLQDYLCHHYRIAVGTTSVRRAIARLGLRWKRARHRLIPTETWRQAKGG